MSSRPGLATTNYWERYTGSSLGVDTRDLKEGLEGLASYTWQLAKSELP